MTMLVVTALSAAACGDDDDEPAGDTSASADVDRYCELTMQLDEAGSEAFRELEQDEDATQEDFEQAEADFVREHEDELAELVDVAPTEIREEVELLLRALRARGGLEEDAPAERDVGMAERTITRFERKNCPATE